MLTDAPLLIFGLGNPGIKYRGTRHNLGFRVLDEVAQRFKIRIDKKARLSLYARVQIETPLLYLIKPQTFMNLSGQCIVKWVWKTNVPSSNLLVVCDDLNLPLGKLRIRKSGMSGGHKGLESIGQALGTMDFPRLKVGIGEFYPKNKQNDLSTQGKNASRFVLENFTPYERTRLPELLNLCADAVEKAIHSGLDAAMNEFNARSL